MRVYKDYDNEYGYCKLCNTKLVKAAKLRENEKLDKIKAELRGNIDHAINNWGH